MLADRMRMRSGSGFIFDLGEFHFTDNKFAIISSSLTSSEIIPQTPIYVTVTHTVGLAVMELAFAHEDDYDMNDGFSIYNNTGEDFGLPKVNPILSSSISTSIPSYSIFLSLIEHTDIFDFTVEFRKGSSNGKVLGSIQFDNDKYAAILQQ
ncbi:MAG TPA: hypothetical protein VFC79_11805 [Tissierellaceae bacterium]|nr:hypothetical protein [Tissierellaceae bacterium]